MPAEDLKGSASVDRPAASTDATTPATRRAGKTPRARRLLPPRRRDHVLPWLALGLLLAIASLGLFVEIGRPDVTDAAEARALATSSQTWREWVRLPDDYRNTGLPIPRYNEVLDYDRPPGVTWLHLLFFSPLDRDEATVEDLIVAGRAASATAALLAVASLFWIGMSIGGLRTALLAGLACVSLPALLYEGRLATAAMPQVAAALLAMAAALWAARPLKPPASLVRQASGWTICGLALGAAVLLGGVAILPKILLPLGAMLAICPRRISYGLALAATCLIAALAVTPWALHAHTQDPEAWRGWLGGLLPEFWFRPAALTRAAGAVTLLTLIALIPWTLWLIGGLVQPFSTSSGGSRQRMLTGWLWFVVLVVVLVTLPPEPGSAHLLLAVPAGAFLVGQVFRQYTDLSDEGRHARFWSVGRWPFLTAVLLASIAGPMMLATQRDLISDGWLDAPIVRPMSWVYWTGVAVALLGLAALGARFAIRHFPARAAACWAGWVMAAWLVTIIPLARGPLATNPARQDALRLREAVGERRVLLVSDDPVELDPVVLLYSGVTVPRISVDQAAALLSAGEWFYALTATGSAPGPVWQPIVAFPTTGQYLWHTLEGRSIAHPAIERTSAIR